MAEDFNLRELFISYEKEARVVQRSPVLNVKIHKHLFLPKEQLNSSSDESKCMDFVSWQQCEVRSDGRLFYVIPCDVGPRNMTWALLVPVGV